MCGICGYYSFYQNISSENILKMNQAIQHRGPDDEGFWICKNGLGKSFSGEDSTSGIKRQFPILGEEMSDLALGFRRLSIVDLSEKGHQPMLSDDEQIIITFNGEIYNFKKLREELEILGYSFKSTSDTEVLIKAYQEWGTEMLIKLDGMFALCITDLIRKKLVLARDRVGMKPLFYHQGEHGLVWASEIKAIVKHEFVRAEINWNGVYTNFLFQTTLAPETCFQHIFSLEPGAFMTVDLNDRTFATEKFWSLPLKVNESITEEEAIKKVDTLLSKSISEQLYADVPVTVMMSGGIDSTLIASKSKPFNEDITAYTISYQFSEEEVKNASLAAKHFELIHHVEKVSDKEILEQLKENIQHFEEPYSSLEVLMNAAKYAHENGCKVVLSGNGADELFGGYSHTLKLNRWLMMKNFNFISPLIVTKGKFSGRVKNYFSQNCMFDFFRQSQTGMRPAEAKHIFRPEIYKGITINLCRYHLSESNNYSGYFEYDMKYSLSSHHVFRDDLSAMKYGVEFRYPYLSNSLIDYVASLPENIRFTGKQNKPLLRKTAKKYLPEEILNMPKRGFSFPLHHYLKNEQSVRDFASENLERLKKRNFFNPDVIDEWWYNLKDDYDFVKIWQLVTFELWYQKYFEK
ncbi:asparagine synthase (glutamine-hydrolyzing) [Chryseobacterium indologenes]|uniref:asparagine synthase (glutamine-hydrolyzing) n=1 Tax=Chryseobacterium indologenes TaxID=253 RepID=UPI000BFBC66B|nr:asparagine synthase (glutamine-hydrolyzing) [Chryseobacterium indologenes]ATN06975.1 asparagine synthase (glutamine-hydrolyzing) [Chryseobacterium indologenes]AYY84279.1 asparagine synthase (glutamine-hydrolyzing) [Chryseobacterium indologenes]QIX81230.1 asparagine synthase (glutamine-hydrolyzing) [Chryseobacterium indologenes]UDQ54923.1 asparagine synthase (glutamine-hydrolyzing) [Chryseobacterium indologenes]HAO28953.1 asparagine synthase (glutamine-hydrolyzing) [Chryseobacterium indologe